MSHLKDLDLREFRASLNEERACLLELSDVSEGDRKTVTLDQQSFGRLSRMDAMQAQEMSKALDGRRQRRLLMIDNALARIDEGQYGYCEACDEDIPLKRLEIDPAVRRCVKCSD